MYPKVNQNVTIDLFGQEQTSRSIIAEVGKKEILISFPIGGNTVGLLSAGSSVVVTYIIGENQYRFQSKIIGRKKDNIPLFRIEKPDEKAIIRIQRRDNFRVNTNLRLLFDGIELTTINLSAGGVLFSCPNDYPVKDGQEIAGSLFIPNLQTKDNEAIPFQAQIKRIYAVDQNKKQVALAFTMMEDRNQKKVVQYCFDRQRQNRMNSRV